MDLLKKQALNAFINGLNKDLLILVKAQKPETLEEAIAIASSEEEEILSKTEIQKFQNINNTNTKHYHYCNKAGHSSFNCYSRNRARGNTDTNIRHIRQPNSSQHYHNPNKNSNYPNKPPVKKCNYCKNLGHDIFECRKRQYNNQKRNSQTTPSYLNSQLNSKS